MSIERFKRASLGSIFPSVAGPAVGGFVGRTIGSKYNAPDLGTMLGAITGGTAGQLIKEKVESDSDIPAGAPYSLDASSQDIPAWAVQGAQLLQPTLKHSEHKEPASDVLLGEIPGANVVQEGINHGIGGAGRAFLGTSLGGVGAGLLGQYGGRGIEHLVGHSVNVPGINMSLPDLLGSVGGAIGATKGLRYMRSV
jgi:hypothetical protein